VAAKAGTVAVAMVEAQALRAGYTKLKPGTLENWSRMEGFNFEDSQHHELNLETNAIQLTFFCPTEWHDRG